MGDHVRLTNAAPDEVEDDIVLRGRIDPDTLAFLLIPSYQRENLIPSKMEALAQAMTTETVPDIDLSMRGNRIREGPDGTVTLLDPVYVIDGHQRTTAALSLLAKGQKPRLGAMIHFGKDEAWERERFKKLNTRQTRVSPNVLLRNAAQDHQPIAILYRLTQDPTFPLHDRVCWAQYRARGHLMSANTYCITTAYLHSGIEGSAHHTLSGLLTGLDLIHKAIGKGMQENTRTFWNAIETCFGLRTITYAQTAPQVKQNFILAVARALTEHTDFWKGTTLTIRPDLLKKMRQFNIQDPEVIRLAAAGGFAHQLLFDLIVTHINSGRRTRRLTRRPLPGRSLAGKRRTTLHGIAKTKHDAKVARETSASDA